MSMSTHIVGFTPPGEEWNRMKAIWDACKGAGVQVPEEVLRFFNWEEPDIRGVKFEETQLINSGVVTLWKEDMREGYEVEVAKIPPGVKVLRFFNSF